MSASDGLIELLREGLEPVAPVSVRRMFGGAGLFADGLMFGLIADDVVYLKADAETAPRFEALGLAPFSYATRGGRQTIMSYWRAPDEVLDDPQALAEWAALAMGAARRAQAAKPAKNGSRGKRKT